MKAWKVFTLALGLALGGAGVASAATNDVAVVFNGQTEVNRESYKFLTRTLRQLGVTVNLKAVQDTSKVKPGNYKAVVVLNTGGTSGLDPKLKAFVGAYPAQGELFVVTLLKGSRDLTVKTETAATSPLGVDTVTAASAWSEGGQKATYVQYHEGWIQVLAQYLQGR